MKKSIEKQVQELKNKYGVDCFNLNTKIFDKLGIYLGKQGDNIVFVTKRGIVPSCFKIERLVFYDKLEHDLEIYLEAINYLFSNIQKIANLSLLKEPDQEERTDCIKRMFFIMNGSFQVYRRVRGC